MSLINGEVASKWISVNHPENGLFKVYWTKDGNATMTDNGLPLRYEWYYRDGKKHGLSKGWNAGGVLRCEMNWKDGEQIGIERWWKKDELQKEGLWKNGKYFLINCWNKNGDIMVKDGNGIFDEKPWRIRTYKDGQLDGLYIRWYDNGQKKEEAIFKNGKFISRVRWDEDGQVK